MKLDHQRPTGHAPASAVLCRCCSPQSTRSDFARGMARLCADTEFNFGDGEISLCAEEELEQERHSPSRLSEQVSPPGDFRTSFAINFLQAC